MKTIYITIKYLILMTLLTGLFYPLFIFGIAKIFFPNKSQGSIIEKNGNKIGSLLIGQKFESPAYFHPRPSAIDYQPMPSGASNLGPTSLMLKNVSDSLKKSFIRNNFLPDNTPIPSDVIFASGSGIDPHISPENAFLQFERICKYRNFDNKKKTLFSKVLYRIIETPQYGFLGEPRINVLILNMELDKL